MYVTSLDVILGFFVLSALIFGKKKAEKKKKKNPGINHFKRHWSAMFHQNSFNVPRHLSMSLLVRVNTIAIIALIVPHLLW